MSIVQVRKTYALWPIVIFGKHVHYDIGKFKQTKIEDFIDFVRYIVHIIHFVLN